MFKLIKSQQFKWPVKVMLPVNGKHVAHEFSATFVKPEHADLIEILSRPDDTASVFDFMQRHLVGWDERVVDENGTPVSFSPETCQVLLNDTFARPAIVTAYIEGVLGQKRKN